MDQYRYKKNILFPGTRYNKDGKLVFFCKDCNYDFSKRYCYLRHIERKTCRKYKIFLIKKYFKIANDNYSKNS